LNSRDYTDFTEKEKAEEEPPLSCVRIKRKRPIHVVAEDAPASSETIVTTDYEPDREIWKARLQRAKRHAQMICVICKNKKMKRGTTVLPIERRKAVLLVTDIPARICANCGEPYIDEKTAKQVEALANEELNGRASLRKSRARRTVVVAEFA